MEQAQQREPETLTIQSIPQQEVEDACFHALGLIRRNCEYLDQHLVRIGADSASRQAVADIHASAAKLERTVNEVMSVLDYLREPEAPRLSPLDLCELLQQIMTQAEPIRTQRGVELILDDGGWTACRGPRGYRAALSPSAVQRSVRLQRRRNRADPPAPQRSVLAADRAG